MSNLIIEERFTLEATPDRVWTYLVDPTRIVGCLPGAELTGQDDDRTYSGTVTVKLGAVKMSYRGKVVFEEIDEAGYLVRLVGKGQEKSGSGTATMTMESRVISVDAGGSEVTVHAEVVLTGKIVRFGRGMIQSVSRGIFQEFTARLADKIAREMVDTEAQVAEPVAESAGEPVSGPAADEPAAVEDNALALLPFVFRAIIRTARLWMSRVFRRG